MTKHFVEWYYPGSFMSETSSEEVNTRDVMLPAKNSPYLGKPFAYRFYDVETFVSQGETLKGKRKNQSGMYYWGTLYTLKEIEQDRFLATLASNMRSNNWPVVVKTILGNYQPFNERTDKLVTL